VRAFWETLEIGTFFVNAPALGAQIGAPALEALRRAGVLRESDEPDSEEISYPDLVRVLRKLYGVKSRGLSIPHDLQNKAGILGSCESPRGEREVLLVVNVTTQLRLALFRPRCTLLLVPTARGVTPEQRASHGPAAWIAIEVLDETLIVHDGRLARAASTAPGAPSVAPDAPGSTRSLASILASAAVLAPVPALAPAPASSRRSLAVRLAGAKVWNEIRISRIDDRTVRIDLPGGSYRLSYVDLGMAHPRTRQPTRVWELLIAFCDDYGIFQKWTFGKADATKKLVSRLGAQLKAVFGLRTTPFHPYRPAEGWRMRLQALPSPPRDRVR
jgi:hypothetical protein